MTEMRFKPMLAAPLAKGNIQNWSDWTGERKYDGWRLLVQVGREVGAENRPISFVRAWTRPRERSGMGAPGKSMAVRPLPSHLVAAFARLPHGVYDGELIAKVNGREGTSSDVSRTELQSSLSFVLFDLLELRGESVVCFAQHERRILLQDAYKSASGLSDDVIALAPSVVLTCQEDVTRLVDAIWSMGGEGVILKRRDAIYHGKRTTDWLKVKKLHSTVMTVIGFDYSQGEKVDRGPFATVRLRDSAGLETSVKTVDDAQLAAFTREWEQRCKIHGKRTLTVDNDHPAIGRQLRIEYQDRTPTGGYRHPRWDRWEDE